MNRLRPALVALATLVALASPARAWVPGDGEVLSVAITSAPGSAEVMIGIRGTVEVRDFLLRSPDRLVLDIAGAKLIGTLALYDGLERAGIRNIRYAQFGPNVVRVVIDLADRMEYTVESSDAGVRVRFGAERFAPSWPCVCSWPPPSSRVAPSARFGGAA